MERGFTYQEVLPQYQVLPRYLRSYPTLKGRSYITSTKRDLTSTRKVQPNLHEEGHYRPRDLTLISQVLPNIHEGGESLEDKVLHLYHIPIDHVDCKSKNVHE
ncbi:hypothetical protein Fot_23569 [Forsythia ovata]|uniref:Uncharacterized protein n=1 Tax=Forsythia ovata TaxID=205694 RepID=A0ABD1V0X4_9LAMI